MTEKPTIQLGDVYRIPLNDGRYAYCQYIHENKELGSMVQVFSLLTPQPLEIADPLRESDAMFSPVFVALRVIAQSGRWPRIGSLPLKPFSFPRFRLTMGTKPGVYHDWRIWDGTNTVWIGDLPENLRKLQLKGISGYETLEERIVAGTYRGDRMF
jgi:hypothetical protein